MDIIKHGGRVAVLCKRIGEKMKMYEDSLVNLVLAAYLHDVGKISIPKEILLKPDKLTEEEMEKVKTHPQMSAVVLDGIVNETVYKAILHHHERYDGKGYPYKLKGRDIPLFSRVISVADAYDAMTSERPYRKVLIEKNKALNELNDNAGTQFDPIVVKLFIDIMLKQNEGTGSKIKYSNLYVR